jgi:4-amino-4-deoxy-L-arabinose transferase-like glycosyltransferase
MIPSPNEMFGITNWEEEAMDEPRELREVPREESWPPSIFACLPLLWTRVLFPGSPPLNTPPSRGERRGAWWLILLLPASLLYTALSFHLFEPDEGRYAQIPREMLARGDWIVPHLQGEPYLDKPPLFYWLVMLSYMTFGVHAWSARLVPALAVHATIVATYVIGRRSLGIRPALCGAIVLTLAPGFLGIGRLLVLDALLALCVTTSLLCAFEAVRRERLAWGWWIASATACGLGVLTKGPIAQILLWPPLLAYLVLNRTPRLSARAVLGFFLVTSAVVLPWYAAICIRKPSFLVYFLWQHNVLRFLTPFDHLQPVWYFAPIVLAGLLPATLLSASFVKFLLASDRATALHRPTELGFFLLAGGWCLAFFSLSGSKLPTYILPCYPMLSLALGYFLAVRGWTEQRWVRGVGGVALGTALIANVVVVPAYARFRSPMRNAERVAAVVSDRSAPVVCYPRHCDSVAFYLGRDDFKNYRSKDTPRLIDDLARQPRTVVLFTHRHSLEALRRVLPKELSVRDVMPLSASWSKGFTTEWCCLAVIESAAAKR